jgi:hypothetical protein
MNNIGFQKRLQLKQSNPLFVEAAGCSTACDDEIEETQVNPTARLSVKAGAPLTKIVSLASSSARKAARPSPEVAEYERHVMVAWKLWKVLLLEKLKPHLQRITHSRPP